MMDTPKARRKFKEWLSRYLLAELLGTFIASGFAYASFVHTHSYVLGAGAGFIGEGIGFYGYFITSELLINAKSYAALSLFKRLTAIIARSGTNLVIEFAPAELIDNLFIRPFFMYYFPQHIKPYALGFIVGKLAADILFYVFVITAYELKNRRRRNRISKQT